MRSLLTDAELEQRLEEQKTMFDKLHTQIVCLPVRTVYIIGNGGSYANSFHIANDLLSVGVRAFCMDPATLTAFANDYGYENAFSKWIEIVGQRDELLIALSGSGKSPNILNAVEAAEKKGMKVWKEFGAEKGLDMQQSEERQLQLGHETMKALKKLPQVETYITYLDQK